MDQQNDVHPRWARKHTGSHHRAAQHTTRFSPREVADVYSVIARNRLYEFQRQLGDGGVVLSPVCYASKAQRTVYTLKVPRTNRAGKPHPSGITPAQAVSRWSWSNATSCIYQQKHLRYELMGREVKEISAVHLDLASNLVKPANACD